MHSIFKYWEKHRAILVLVAVFLVTRLIAVTLLPPFNDESVHIDWGYKELHGKGLFFSLYDAKQPLLMWLFGLSQSIFTDPLFAGRLVSVLFGVATLLGLYELGSKVLSPKGGWYAATIYMVTPLFFFFDRQALMEGPLAACAVWIINLYLRLHKQQRMSTAVILGCVLGGAFFIKTTAVFFLVALLAVYAAEKWVFKVAHGAPFPALLILAGTVSQLVVMPLYFQPLFWQTLGRTAERSLSFREVLAFPIGQWTTTALSVSAIAWWHYTPVLIILGCIGIFALSKNHVSSLKAIRSTGVYAGMLVLLYVLSARSTPVRYVVPIIWWWPLCVAAGFILLEHWRWLWRLATISMCIPLALIALLLYDPPSYFMTLARFTAYAQKDEYLTQWPAGYGTREALEIVRAELKGVHGVVAVRADAGNPESTMFMYLNANKQIQPLFLDTTVAPLLANYQCVATSRPLFFVSRDSQLGGLEQFMIEKVRIQKPENKSSVGIYTLKPCLVTQKVLTLDFE